MPSCALSAGHRASQLQFLQVTNVDAEVLKLAVCKLYPASYGRAEDVMTAQPEQPHSKLKCWPLTSQQSWS